MTYFIIGIIWTFSCVLLSAFMGEKRTLLQIFLGILFWPIDMLISSIILIVWAFSLIRS